MSSAVLDLVNAGVTRVVMPRTDAPSPFANSEGEESEYVPRSCSALSLAEQFHATYERLAPEYGYETRPETRVFDPASANGKLMIAVCQSIIQQNSVVDRNAPPNPQAGKAQQAKGKIWNREDT